MVNYDRLPGHMQHGAKLYIEEGILPGSFLMSVLCNNLVESFGRADTINKQCMVDWCMWLYNDIPGNAWGSKDIVEVYANSVRERLSVTVD